MVNWETERTNPRTKGSWNTHRGCAEAHVGAAVELHRGITMAFNSPPYPQCLLGLICGQYLQRVPMVPNCQRPTVISSADQYCAPVSARCLSPPASPVSRVAQVATIFAESIAAVQSSPEPEPEHSGGCSPPCTPLRVCAPCPRCDVQVGGCAYGARAPSIMYPHVYVSVCV